MGAERPVERFALEVPSLDSYWRAIILFGRNVASYKFALAGAPLELGNHQQDDELVRLEALALPFARRVADHLRDNDKQGTFERSRFLDACRSYNSGDLDEDGLRDKTVELGFANVIDAFHVVDRSEIPQRFFTDERRSSKAIRLTDRFWELVAAPEAVDLPEEIEARWRLVETAWALNLPRHVLTVDYDPTSQSIIVPRRRKSITGARGALNGYQKGHCFYCFAPISLLNNAGAGCEVDHVFAWSLGPFAGGAQVDGIWNLVLACPRCNNWHEKADRPPDVRYVKRLNRRNEFLIASHHPLRPTLIAQTGATTVERRATLRRALNEVTVSGARTPWTALYEGRPAF